MIKLKNEVIYFLYFIVKISVISSESRKNKKSVKNKSLQVGLKELLMQTAKSKELSFKEDEVKVSALLNVVQGESTGCTDINKEINLNPLNPNNGFGTLNLMISEFFGLTFRATHVLYIFQCY